MAEKFKDSLSREIRYMEYKLRKRKTDQGQEKKRNSTPDYPRMPQYSTCLPTEFKNATPSNPGEEDLQLQVAIAMSKEEAKDEEKTQMSDKIRLEMAMKESADIASKLVQNNTPTSNGSGMQNRKDPWGMPISSKAAFDPFTSGTSDQSNNGFGSDAWGSSGSNVSPTKPVKTDPWKSADVGSYNAPSTHFALSDPWTTNSETSQSTDPWKPVSLPANNSTVAFNDPWNTATASNSSFGQVSNQSNKTGLSSLQSENSSAFTPTKSFDPLEDFDKLSLQPAPHTTPYTAAPDMFSGSIMIPQPANTSQVTNLVPTSSNNGSTVRAGEFLGPNADLVKLDTLVTKPSSNHPYISLSPSTTGALTSNRNPFDQKAPTKSLNQMKSVSPANFRGQMQTSLPQAVSYPTPVQPMQMTLQPAMGIVVQPAYGMTVNPFASGPAAQHQSYSIQPRNAFY